MRSDNSPAVIQGAGRANNQRRHERIPVGTDCMVYVEGWRRKMRLADVSASGMLLIGDRWVERSARFALGTKVRIEGEIAGERLAAEGAIARFRNDIDRVLIGVRDVAWFRNFSPENVSR